MEQPKASTQARAKSPGVYLKLPGIQILLNGPLSVIALIILLAIIGGMFYLMITRSGPGEWASGGLWLAFIMYWSAAALPQKSDSGESVLSAVRHGIFVDTKVSLMF